VPDKKEIAVGFISALIIFLTLFFTGIVLIGDPMLHQAVSFSLAAEQIASAYPLPYSTSAGFASAERSMFSILDPFSYRMERRDFSYLVEESSGEYGGVGISVVPRDTLLMIITVREGGPGYEAGMKSGDLIIRVDSTAIPHNDPSLAIGSIRGPSGSKVRVTVYRPSLDDTLSLTLTRQDIKLEHIPYYGMTTHGTAYIRISDFEAGCAGDLYEAVLALEDQKPAGYIIDLKGNPGGYLDEGIDAADLFLDKGELIVGTSGHSRWESREFRSTTAPLTDKPIVMLVDRGTASAAEIFTGALRGANRGIVVGDTTFGKGLVQTIFSLPNHDALRLTTSRYYFADGRYLNPPDTELSYTGLSPDVYYAPRGEIAFQDLMLSGFLIYDFIDQNADFLDQYPDDFDYPDTVITRFESFARSQGITYRSWMTETIDYALQDQVVDSGPPQVLDKLHDMLAYSKQLDTDVYTRWSDFLKYHIRRIAIERRSGRAAAYRHVIVPGREDINLASVLLLDKDHYQQILRAPQPVAGADSVQTAR